MKDKVKAIVLALWANHKKKVIALIASLILMGASAITGVPTKELKEMIHEATAPAVVEVMPETAPSLPPELREEK